MAETRERSLAMILDAQPWELKAVDYESVIFLAEVLGTQPRNLPVLEKLFLSGDSSTQLPIADLLLKMEGGKDVAARGLSLPGQYGRLAKKIAPELANEPKYVPHLLAAFQDDEQYRAHESLGAALATTAQGREALTDIVRSPASDSSLIRATRALGPIGASVPEISAALVKAQNPHTRAEVALSLVGVKETKELVFAQATRALAPTVPNQGDDFLAKLVFLKALEGNELGKSTLLGVLQDVPARDPAARYRQGMTSEQEGLAACAAIGLKGHPGIEATLHGLFEEKISGSYVTRCLERLVELDDRPFLLGALEKKNWHFDRTDEKVVMTGVAHLPEGRTLLERLLNGGVREGTLHDLETIHNAALALATNPEGRVILEKAARKGNTSAAFALDPRAGEQRMRPRATSDYAVALKDLDSSEPAAMRLRAAIDIIAHTREDAVVQYL